MHNGYYQDATGRQSDARNGMNGGYRPETGGDENNDDWPLDKNGHDRLNDPFWHKVHQLAQIGLAAGNVAAGFNPIANAITAFSGQNADGSCASKFDRLMAAFGVVDGVGDLGEIGEAESTVARLCREGNGRCFVAGTPVQMADGTIKPIEQIKEGDKVFARNPATGKTEVKTVTRTLGHTADELVKAEFADAKTGKVVATIEGTPEHPFFVESGGMVMLGKLGIGTKVLVRAGPALVVKSITRESHTKGIPVYNFEVEDDHTYFIGDNSAGGGIWVHNDCGLRFIGNGVWESPGGLRFGPGSAQGHRLAHVMEHLAPDLSKPLHSVFDVQEHLIRTLDEAWAMRGSSIVQGNRELFIIPMGRVVGTNGETNMSIVVDRGTSSIVTAFPSR